MNAPSMFDFRLFVAGDALNSTQALANLTALCREYIPDRHRIEIVDVYKEPRRALTEGVLMTPTLLKIGPAPGKRIVGALSQTQTVLNALGIGVLA